MCMCVFIQVRDRNHEVQEKWRVNKSLAPGGLDNLPQSPVRLLSALFRNWLSNRKQAWELLPRSPVVNNSDASSKWGILPLRLHWHREIVDSHLVRKLVIVENAMKIILKQTFTIINQ